MVFTSTLDTGVTEVYFFIPVQAVSYHNDYFASMYLGGGKLFRV